MGKKRTLSCVDEKRPDVVPSDADDDAIPQAESDNSVLPTRVAIERLGFPYQNWIIKILDLWVWLIGPARLVKGFADIALLSQGAISSAPSIADLDAKFAALLNRSVGMPKKDGGSLI